MSLPVVGDLAGGADFRSDLGLTFDSGDGADDAEPPICPPPPPVACNPREAPGAPEGSRPLGPARCVPRHSSSSSEIRVREALLAPEL